MEKCEHEQDELLAAADAVGVKGGDDHEIFVLDSSACRDVAHRGAFHGHDADTIVTTWKTYIDMVRCSAAARMDTFRMALSRTKRW